MGETRKSRVSTLKSAVEGSEGLTASELLTLWDHPGPPDSFAITAGNHRLIFRWSREDHFPGV